MTEILLLADAAPSVGLGHLSRSSALAVALQSRQIATRCIGLGADRVVERYGIRWEPSSTAELGRPHAVVIDTYFPLPDPVRVLRAAVPAVLLSDLGTSQDAELTVNPAKAGDGDERHLFGFRHAMLGPMFWGAGDRDIASAVRRVLVTVGRSDKISGARDIVACVRAGFAGDVEVRAVGMDPAGVAGVVAIEPQESLQAEMVAADLVVCGAGQTMLEACALGCPCVAVVLAENQARAARGLASTGAIAVARIAELSDVIATVHARVRRGELSAAARIAVDGYGALRVAYRIAALLDVDDEREP